MVQLDHNALDWPVHKTENETLSNDDVEHTVWLKSLACAVASRNARVTFCTALCHSADENFKAKLSMPDWRRPALRPKCNAEEPTYRMGYHKGASSSSRKKRFPWSESNPGPSRYGAYVYSIAPFRYGRSSSEFRLWILLSLPGRKLHVLTIFFLRKGLRFFSQTIRMLLSFAQFALLAARIGHVSELWQSWTTGLP